MTADHVDCEECTYNGRWSVDRHRDCQYYLDPKKLQPADLLIVLGSGESQQHLQEEGNTNRPERDLLKERQWPALLTLFNSGLIDHQTMSVHVPIRRNTNLQKMFYFHHKIYDGDFLKPLSMQSLKEMEIICSKEPKVKDLIYVGRYKEDKGQLQFLEMVDAGDAWLIPCTSSPLVPGTGNAYLLPASHCCCLPDVQGT